MLSAFMILYKCLNTTPIGAIPRIRAIPNMARAFDCRASSLAPHRSGRVRAKEIKRNWHGVAESIRPPSISRRGQLLGKFAGFVSGRSLSSGSPLHGIRGDQVTRRSLVFSHFNSKGGTFASTILNTVLQFALTTRIQFFYGISRRGGPGEIDLAYFYYVTARQLCDLRRFMQTSSACE